MTIEKKLIIYVCLVLQLKLHFCPVVLVVPLSSVLRHLDSQREAPGLNMASSLLFMWILFSFPSHTALSSMLKWGPVSQTPGCCAYGSS